MDLALVKGNLTTSLSPVLDEDGVDGDDDEGDGVGKDGTSKGLSIITMFLFFWLLSVFFSSLFLSS